MKFNTFSICSPVYPTFLVLYQSINNQSMNRYVILYEKRLPVNWPWLKLIWNVPKSVPSRVKSTL